MKCPITGVNIPRFLAAVLVGFVFCALYNYLVHGVMLMGEYQRTPALWRSQAEMAEFALVMMAFQFAQTLVAAFIFTRHYEGKGVLEGVRFGLMLGVLLGLLMAASYAWSPISPALAAMWFVDGVVLGLGWGILFALVYRRAA